VAAVVSRTPLWISQPVVVPVRDAVSAGSALCVVLETTPYAARMDAWVSQPVALQIVTVVRDRMEETPFAVKTASSAVALGPATPLSVAPPILSVAWIPVRVTWRAVFLG